MGDQRYADPANKSPDDLVSLPFCSVAISQGITQDFKIPGTCVYADFPEKNSLIPFLLMLFACSLVHMYIAQEKLMLHLAIRHQGGELLLFGLAQESGMGH